MKCLSMYSEEPRIIWIISKVIKLRIFYKYWSVGKAS